MDYDDGLRSLNDEDSPRRPETDVTIRMRLSPYPLTALGSLLARVSAGCTSVSFTGEHGADGFTAYGAQMKVSETVRCTRDAAEASAATNGTLACAMPTYAAGLVVHGEIRNTTVVSSAGLRDNVLGLVRDAVPRDDVNFNRTVVIRYAPAPFAVPLGQTWFLTFAPRLACWDATLGGCADDDDGLEGAPVRVCGYRFLPAASGDRAPAQLRYDGDGVPVRTDGPANDTRPQPAYEDVKDLATNDLEGDDGGSAAASLAFSSTALAMSVFCALLVAAV
ncbi:hypothetical protein F4780DRAFT_785152 [Xylariomycetidae sp. FL0641]|nr:hypothetical protein F4780DRAFT_785152 [Xylariomycetidae sp. FL0641]